MNHILQKKSAFLHIWIFYEEMMNRMKFAVIYSIYLVIIYCQKNMINGTWDKVL